MVARIAQSVAIGGFDQRAAANAAEGLYGTEMGQIVANMEQTTNTKGGFLVDTDYSSDFIDVLRPRVVIRNMGARPVPMPEGNLTTRKKTAGSSASYVGERVPAPTRSEEHTSELQSLMRTSYAVFCLKQQKP